jgi:ABC-2 type transport system permease protein
MRAFSITIKDLQIFIRDRGSFLWAFVIPMVFILLFTGISSSIQNEAGQDSPGITLVVINLDSGGSQADEFLNRLQGTGKLAIELVDENQAKMMRDEEEIPYLLTIPQGFSQSITANQQVNLVLEKISGDQSEFDSLNLILDGVARDLALKAYILGSLEQIGQMQQAAPGETQLFTYEQMKAQAEGQFEQSKTEPLIVISEEIPAAIQERLGGEDLSWAQVVVPGFAVLFVFLTAQTTASSIYDEKKVGSFRRLMAAPLTRYSILSGKLLPNFLVVLVQFIVIFASSLLILPLIGVEAITLGNNLLALVLVCAFTALCSTSLGILIAALARTEGQISGVSQLVLWITGLLGGCIVPLTLFNNQALNTISKFVPQSWALNGLMDLMVRGYGLQDVLPELGALLVFSLVFFAIGLWRFDFN